MTIKLFFFDMEGTIFAEKHASSGSANDSMWHRIACALGDKAVAQDAAMYSKWDRGEYGSYMEWIAETMKMYQQEGLTRDTFANLIHSIKYNEGVHEVVEELHKKDIKIAIISGGFMAHAGRAQQELKIEHAFAAVKIFWSEQGTVEHWNILPANEKGKVDFVELLRKEYGFSKEECAFVGDGKNDVHIAAHVGLSFAYKAHPALQKVATHSIEDFRDILKYV